MTEEPAGSNIREVLEQLVRIAERLPLGVDTPVKFGICDGVNLQMIDAVDVDHFATVDGGGEVKELFVMFKCHQHPGTSPGELLQGVTADLDEELREITGVDTSRPDGPETE